MFPKSVYLETQQSQSYFRPRLTIQSNHTHQSSPIAELPPPHRLTTHHAKPASPTPVAMARIMIATTKACRTAE